MSEAKRVALQPAKLLLPFVTAASASGSELAYSGWILRANGYVSLAAPSHRASQSVKKVAELSRKCPAFHLLPTHVSAHTARKVAASPSSQLMLKSEQTPRSFSCAYDRTYDRTCPLHMTLVLQDRHTFQASGKTKHQAREQKQNSRSYKC